MTYEPLPSLPENQPGSDEFDYLCVEQALIQRLTATVPTLLDVLSDSSLDGVEATQLKTPSASVFWARDALPEAPHNVRDIQEVQQLWAVVLVVKVAGDKTGNRARASAGPLIAQVVRSVRGWRPFEGFEPFVWVADVEPSLSPGGRLLIPLFFETSFAL